ncbi:uncharacterized protein LACBIDRAFT_336093 [Laccaria bicolor S238N-H82]|uniref:Predicted protein n=1 Tax=Laccaria bicolor (strain S238N-H82 / ATCC MYA-4686) TaxID=486041 RepID=B0DPW0_LACBS|nr:uncharacterized protein LACBIDRAFT_331576 [Laccaria bicolor S238N-H82]XP_001891053.1 uncharacterized protein LACBIDRAFT_336093 [Laccaria bicolor S238N-H82]EDQ98296.1 predicted protein [Laccaria bicolor S238N-H82]EDR03524.1 predicted protein [Laccaria bicolor S238N-H82]|eukprot:XP_001885980.1 predicted protein [Laccaria bicolor S238N-H82]
MLLSKARARQPATKGFGQAFRSPHKRQDSQKSSTFVTYLSQEDKICRLKAKLAQLQALPPEELTVMEEDEGGGEGDGLAETEEAQGSSPVPDDWMDVEAPANLPQPPPSPPRTPISAKICRTGPDAATNLLYEQWKALTPLLIAPLVRFLSMTKGIKYSPPGDIRASCLHPHMCVTKTRKVLWSAFDHLVRMWVNAQLAVGFLCQI